MMTKFAQKYNISGRTNIILQALISVNKDWADLIERVHLKSGQLIIHAGVRPSLIYFPVDGLVSILVSPVSDWKKQAIQSAMCGDEDIVGFPALLSEVPSNYQAVVELDAPAFQCSTQAARRLLDECPKSRAIIGRYADLALTEAWEVMGGSVALATEDRLISFLTRAWYVSNEKTLPFSQPFIAKRMGARRPSITEMLARLETRGLIRRDVARVDVINPEALLEHLEHIWPAMLVRRKAFKSAMAEA